MMGQLSEHRQGNQLAISLFGKFSVQFGGQPFDNLEGCKVQELFSYLLLHRERPHPRETLANLLWNDVSTAQSKSYLRKALWQLQATLDAHTQSAIAGLLRVESDWVQLNLAEGLWLDAAIVEGAFNLCHGQDGRQLAMPQVQMLQSAVELYQGELLEGWFQEWCLYERERFQHMTLVMLDKLMNYCEAQGAYETGVIYGTRILQYDQARERTHRQLMRLYYLAGDRTEALRQYERCVALLHKELNVGPARQTVALYKEICADQPRFDATTQAPIIPQQASAIPSAMAPSLAELLAQFQHAENVLTEVQQAMRQNIQQLETLLQSQPTQHSP
jgi:DNA-binding SARP family transcriptional activator